MLQGRRYTKYNNKFTFNYNRSPQYIGKPQRMMGFTSWMKVTVQMMGMGVVRITVRNVKREAIL